MSADDITWFRNGSVSNWATARAHRGYTAAIVLVGPTYTLTITGSGAPGPVGYATLRNAKDAFRHFLLDKPVS